MTTIKKYQKVRDHCHYIERFRGAAQKEWKWCREREKINSACDFIGLKNNKLQYKCKEF